MSFPCIILPSVSIRPEVMDEKYQSQVTLTNPAGPCIPWLYRLLLFAAAPGYETWITKLNKTYVELIGEREQREW